MQLSPFSLWMWKAISHWRMLCQPMQLGSVLGYKSTNGIWYQTLLVLFSPSSSLPPPSPTINLSKIEVVYILLLWF